jgi:hypothetical protein
MGLLRDPYPHCLDNRDSLPAGNSNIQDDIVPLEQNFKKILE